MRPAPATIPVLIDAAEALKGSQRRPSMAKTVGARGRRGQAGAEAHLRCDLRTGMAGIDALSRRRRPAQEHRPRPLDAIRSIADRRSQADPGSQTERLAARIGAAEARRRSIATKGYTDEQLPARQTIDKELHLRGYCPAEVANRRPREESSRPTPASSV